jgi:hypothetical protein
MSGPTIAHAVLMSVLVLLAVAAVVIAVVKKGAYFKTHRLLTRIAILAGAAGVATMFVWKAVNGWPHVASQHAQSGIVAFVLLAAAAAGGTFAANSSKTVRIAHRALGGIALALALLALAGGIANVAG